MVIKRSLIWLYSAATYLLWAVIILVAAAVLGLRYYVLPGVQQHKDAIAQRISKEAGQKISIGDIKASWDGMQPQLDLYRVQLFDARDRPALTLDHIETSLSWLSLPLAEPRLARLVIHRPQLSVRRETDGTIYVAGISMSGPSRPEFPNWLLRQSQVDILDAAVIWQDDQRGAPPLELRNLTFRLANPPWESFLGRHRFGLRATPSVGASGPIEIRGNLLGSDVSRLQEWRGTVYARADGTQLADWSPWISYPFDIRQGFGAARFWLEFSDARVDAVTADVLLQNLSSRFGRLAQEITLQNVAGRLAWDRLKDGSELRASKITLSSGGLQMQDGELKLVERSVNGVHRIAGALQLENIGLEPLTVFAGSLPLDTTFSQALAQASPRGQLQRLKLDWETDAGVLSRYTLRSRFSQLGVNGFANIPGFTNASGSIDASQEGGTLNLEASKSVISAPDLFRWPLPLDQLSGQVQWKWREALLEVKISNLALASPHLAATFNAVYRAAKSGLGEIDLNGRIARAEIKQARYYFPRQLGKDTLHWLDTSFLGGTASDFNIEVRGNLDQFPWPDSKNGLFKISGHIKDAQVDYATGWPLLQKMDAGLLFQGNRMELNANRGVLFGNQITRMKAAIPALDAQHPVLLIDSELNSPMGELVRYINNSPLLDSIDHFTEGLAASGEGRLSLNMSIPLDTEGKGSKVKGSYQVSDGALSGSSEFPALSAMHGKLDFTEESILAQNMTANIFGGPTRFSLQSRPDGTLLVNASGMISDTGLREAFDLPLLARLHGTTDWSGEIQIDNREADLSIQSSLAGISSSLPPPLDKVPSQTLPLLVTRKSQGPGQDLVSVSLGKVLNAKLLVSQVNGKQQVTRGDVGFGSAAELPAQNGIHLHGQLDYLDLDQWRAVLAESPSSAANQPDTRISADLALKTLDVVGRRINDLKLNASSIEGGWRIGLQSREITGDATWLSAGYGKVVARLKTLISPAFAPAQLSAPGGASTKIPDYPALDIVAEQFEAKQKKLGRLELLALNRGNDWVIEKLLISNPESTLEANGEWRNWRSNPVTRLNLMWTIQNVGKTLERFGYPDLVRGGSGAFSGNLRWPGSPHEFSYNELSGNLVLDAKSVQFLKLKPGVGRLLGVLSLQTLPRRLTFDFRDVFSEGFTFDKISSNVQIERGVMKSDDLVMEGPAARVNITGSTDLNRETQNLRIKVTPLVSDTVSLAAFAGGPAVGAIALLAQKILRDPLNKLAAFEFEIGGTWDDPQEIKRQDTKPAAPGPIPRG